MENFGLKLWELLADVPKEFLQEFEAASGFKGTAINPMFGRCKMTEIFGPVGYGWGYEDDQWQIVGNIIFCRINLWYRPFFLDNSVPFEVLAWVREHGGTNLTKAGDEARKQTVTDGLSRCFMALGLAAEIYAGFKDSKYNQDHDPSADKPGAPKQEQSPKNGKAPSPAAPQKKPSPKIASSPAQQPPQPTVVESQEDEIIQQFISKLVSSEPLLATCDVRRKGASLFFAYEKGGGNDREYIASGFVAPAKHPDLLCKRYDIPFPPSQADRIQ